MEPPNRIKFGRQWCPAYQVVQENQGNQPLIHRLPCKNRRPDVVTVFYSRHLVDFLETARPDNMNPRRRRRVYAGLVVVLVSAMIHGLKLQRMQRLREVLEIDRRTLERWRQWWLSLFVESAFWREARPRFMPPLCQKALPLSLCVIPNMRASRG